MLVGIARLGLKVQILEQDNGNDTPEKRRKVPRRDDNVNYEKGSRRFRQALALSILHIDEWRSQCSLEQKLFVPTS